MADTTLDELIERTRLESGLRNNAYYDESQIIRYLNAGGAELYDLFTQANQHYVISQFDFTTTGPGDAIITLPTDFQQGHSLEIYPDTPGQTLTIKYLPNWLNRNAFGNNVFALSPGGYYPCYTFLANQLRFYPPQCVPAAPFRLYYTPMWESLAPGETATYDIGTSASLTHNRTIDLEQGDRVDGATRTWFFRNGRFSATETPAGALLAITSAGNSGTWTVETVISETTITTFETPVTESFDPLTDDAVVNDVFQYSFPNAAFTEDMIGGELVIAFGAGPPDNTGFNGTFTIFDVLSSTTAQIQLWNPGSNITNPTEGSITVNWQEPGTRPDLPNVMGPWSEYLVVYAAIAINIDRQRGTGELERKLNALKARVASILSTRQEEPLQPPLTRGDGFGGGWGSGWGD